MESESIYLCDVQKSNDFMELKHYKGKFAGIGCFGEYWEAISFVLNKWSEETKCFALCLSEEKDDVAQWERYGEKARGVAIGFSDVALSKLTEELNEGIEVIPQERFSWKYQRMLFGKMSYREQPDSYEIAEVSRMADIKKYIESSAFVKAKGFSCEKEHRLAFVRCGVETPLISQRITQEQNKWILHNLRELITEIYIGPLCPKENVVKVEELCDKYGIKVLHSKIPLCEKTQTEES